jgi:hypothetical protein
VNVASHVPADSALDIWVNDHLPDPALVAALHEACRNRGKRRVASVATDGHTWIAEGLPWRQRHLPHALRWQGPRREDFTVAPDASKRLIIRARPLGDTESDAVVAALIDPSGAEFTDGSLEDARRIVRALQSVHVRDRVLWHVCANPTVARTLGERLATILRVVGPRATGQVALTAAMAFWAAGDGFRASVALDRALADSPQEPLGHMVEAALRSGLPPSAWVQAMKSIPDEDCLRGRVCA